MNNTTFNNASTSTILHVDINSYFATLQQQENPHLRGRPIGVVKDEGRSCIIAASKEAKKFGIKTGADLPEARLRCPDLLTIPAQFDRYLDATRRLKKIFTQIAPAITIYSLDEAFIDISDCQQHLYPDPHHLGRQIQQLIKNDLGEWVTASVGIGPNRFLAKMASEISPPESVFEINHHNLDAVLAEVKFNDVCGIGYQLEKKLLKMGITHPYLIRLYSNDDLLPIFGPFWTKELKKMAYGQEPHHLELLNEPLPHMKSVGRSITGYKLYDNEQEIKSILYNLTEEVTHKVRQMKLAGRAVNVSLFGQNRGWGQAPQIWHQHLTLKYYLRHTQEMFQLIYDQLYRNWQREFKVIKFGVRLGMLEPVAEINPSLLPEAQQQEKISAAKDYLTEKYGLFTLRSGVLLNQPLIRPEVTGFLGDKTYHQL